MELEYDIEYESCDHDGYCTDNECNYKTEEIIKRIIINQKYFSTLWCYFIMLRKYLPIDIIGIILPIRINFTKWDKIKPIEYEEKKIFINFAINQNIYAKCCFTTFLLNNNIETILGKIPRGYSGPNFYCNLRTCTNGLGQHEHRITIKRTKLNKL